MRVALALLAISAVGFCLVGCQAPKQTFERVVYGDPGKPYLGMSKEQIIACAGQPSGSYSSNTGETLTYHYSGAGPVPSAPKKQDDSKQANPVAPKKSDKNYDCSASLYFEGGHLAHVNFAPRLVVSPYKEVNDPKTGEKKPVPQPTPCTFSLPNCAAH
jgi:hypothetical protein